MLPFDRAGSRLDGDRFAPALFRSESGGRPPPPRPNNTVAVGPSGGRSSVVGICTAFLYTRAVPRARRCRTASSAGCSCATSSWPRRRCPAIPFRCLRESVPCLGRASAGRCSRSRSRRSRSASRTPWRTEIFRWCDRSDRKIRCGSARRAPFASVQGIPYRPAPGSASSPSRARRAA